MTETEKRLIRAAQNQPKIARENKLRWVASGLSSVTAQIFAAMPPLGQWDKLVVIEIGQFDALGEPVGLGLFDPLL